MAMFLESLGHLMQWQTLASLFVVVIMGLIFGALPGLNATMAVAILLPVTFLFDQSTGLALLIAAYVSGVSGGLVSSTLLRIPGTPSSIATTFDAYPLAQSGQAVKALGTGMLASFLGGMISLGILIFFAPAVAGVAISFGPYEYASLAALALAMVGVMSGDNMTKGLLAVMLGMALSFVGFAPIDGTARFSFGLTELNAGIGMLPFMVGLFALPQLIREIIKLPTVKKLDVQLSGFGVTFAEIRANLVNLVRSALIGAGIGVLPGIGGAASNLIAYAVAKKSSRQEDTFGKGNVAGIWASEGANNASIGGALLPLLALGIPGDGVTAMLIGGFEIHGLQPGPMLFLNTPDVIHAIYAAFLVTAVLVLILQLSTLRLFPRILLIPRHYLVPVLVVLTAVGAYAADFRFFDLWVMLGIGVLGYYLERFQFPLAPVVLGFVMGPLLEENLRRALLLSEGDMTSFLTRPYSAVFSIVCFLVIALGLWRQKARLSRGVPSI
jgi:putative tricarboxylic transport membrane protein